MKRGCALLCLGVFLAITVTGRANTPVEVPDSATVDITSDRLSVDHDKKSARFEGNVRAVFGKIRVTCAVLSLSYNDSGRVAQLTARGRVTVVTEDARAVAGSARLNAARNLLILEDSPSIVRGPHRLAGSRIEVHLGTGKVEVRDARGVFQLGGGAQ